MRKTSGFSFTGAVRGPLAALDEAAVWLNSPPLTATSLRGRTVLVDFWTYSCVNWLRTLPYVRAWAQRYGEQGLVVIGAHAPEFGFEHDLDNVRWAIAELEVGYPVVIDNDFAIWRAFDNHYWPAIYLVDRDGRVRFHHFGEEAYAETERAVQQLLGVDDELARVDADGLAAAADWAALKSPETYVGYARGERRTEREPTELALNQWTLNGRWTVEEESAVLDGAGSIAYRFEGRDLNLVLAAAGDRGAAPFTILLDGELPGTDSGIDVDESGGGTVTAPRMYQLVRQHGSIRPRTFEMQFPDGGVRAYVFTFG
jgi:thiol-disulfide isomerase/thioredoxin